MILTEEMLFSEEACQEGVQFAIENNLFGKDMKEVKAFCASAQKTDFYIWCKERVESAEYVKSKGNYFMTNKYKVFNPLNGLHVTCNSLEEAANATKEVAMDLLKGFYEHPVIQEVSNESGDTAWDSLDIKLGDLLEITPKSSV